LRRGRPAGGRQRVAWRGRPWTGQPGEPKGRGAAWTEERRRKAARLQAARRRAGKVTVFVLATGWLVVVIAPIYYMVLASFRCQGSYLTANPWLPSGGLTLGEYGTVFGAGLGRYLLNSVIITVVFVLLTTSMCLGAAFRIVRRSTRAAA